MPQHLALLGEGMRTCATFDAGVSRVTANMNDGILDPEVIEYQMEVPSLQTDIMNTGVLLLGAQVTQRAIACNCGTSASD